MSICEKPPRLNWAPGIVDYTDWQQIDQYWYTVGSSADMKRKRRETYIYWDPHAKKSDTLVQTIFVSKLYSRRLPQTKNPDQTRKVLCDLIDQIQRENPELTLNKEYISCMELPHALADKFGLGRFCSLNITVIPPETTHYHYMLGGSAFCYEPLGTRTVERARQIILGPEPQYQSIHDNKLLETFSRYPPDRVVVDTMVNHAQKYFDMVTHQIF